MNKQTDHYDYLEEDKSNDTFCGSSIDVESTSAFTASVTSKVLSQSDTDVTRLVFEPTFVDNKHDVNKCISGKLIYENGKFLI